MISGRIQPAMEETAQEILQAVENIEVQVEGMESIVVANSGTDWSKFSPFVYVPIIQISSAQDTDYHTACEIVGKGYLSNAYTDGNGADQQIKITVDETVVFEGKGQGGAKGIVQEQMLNLHGTNQYLAVPTVTSPGVHTIASLKVGLSDVLRDNSISIISQPLFFEHSLLVEIKKASTSVTSIQMRPFINGGVSL